MGRLLLTDPFPINKKYKIIELMYCKKDIPFLELFLLKCKLVFFYFVSNSYSDDDRSIHRCKSSDYCSHQINDEKMNMTTAL